ALRERRDFAACSYAAPVRDPRDQGTGCPHADAGSRCVPCALRAADCRAPVCVRRIRACPDMSRGSEWSPRRKCACCPAPCECRARSTRQPNVLSMLTMMLYADRSVDIGQARSPWLLVCVMTVLYSLVGQHKREGPGTGVS